MIHWNPASISQLSRIKIWFINEYESSLLGNSSSYESSKHFSILNYIWPIRLRRLHLRFLPRKSKLLSHDSSNFPSLNSKISMSMINVNRVLDQLRSDYFILQLLKSFFHSLNFTFKSKRFLLCLQLIFLRSFFCIFNELVNQMIDFFWTNAEKLSNFSRFSSLNVSHMQNCFNVS